LIAGIVSAEIKLRLQKPKKSGPPAQFLAVVC
jgi:hypothetical protein